MNVWAGESVGRETKFAVIITRVYRIKVYTVIKALSTIPDTIPAPRKRVEERVEDKKKNQRNKSIP